MLLNYVQAVKPDNIRKKQTLLPIEDLRLISITAAWQEIGLYSGERYELP